MSSGHLRGNISTESLYNLPQSFTQCQEHYGPTNSYLDVIVGGCKLDLNITIVRATQPDTADPNAPAAGSGGPYQFTEDATHHITACKDHTGGTVDLAACVAAAAYSAAFQFTTDRVISPPPVPNRIVSVSWSASEATRLGRMAPSLGVASAADVQKRCTYIISYILGFVSPSPTPVTLDPPGTAVTYTDTWTPDEFGVLDRVKAKFVLNDADAERFATKLVDYLLALGGH
jgi:hypothetical protein